MTAGPRCSARGTLTQEIHTFLTEVGLHSPCCDSDKGGGFTVAGDRPDGSVQILWMTANGAFEDRPRAYRRAATTMEGTVIKLLRGAGYAADREPHGAGVLAARA